MYLKSMVYCSVFIFIFTLGFLAGGVNWEWRNPSNSADVAFWSMLGGWVSGLATFAAVIVSLYMAYQSSLSDVEKISIRIGGPDKVGFGDSYFMNVRIQNLRNVRVEISDLKLVVDDIKISFSINHLTFPIGDGLHDLLAPARLPFLMDLKGQIVDLPVSIDSGNRWWGIFNELSKEALLFKKAKLQIYSNMNTYQVVLPKVFLSVLKERYEAYERIK